MKKLISSIFLVTGTSVGGGMLLLPAIIGIYGYFSALIILTAVWLINIVIAFIFLEANCYLPQGTSLISMSNKLLGKRAEWVTWIITLLFLYTLLCLYISGITDIFGSFFSIPSMYLSLVPVIVVSFIMYFGMNYIASFNRFIVITMFTTFIAMILFMLPSINIDQMLSAPQKSPHMALPIVFTSFGFLTIIPSLRSFLNDDIKKLKIAIVLGSAIPLILYALWTSVVMGAIPAAGQGGLSDILLQPDPITNLKSSLIHNSSSSYISLSIQLFILFAIIGAFIGISVGLYDFLADGFKIAKNKIGKFKLLALTFVPPLIITFTQSRLFVLALSFASLISIILFGFYPLILAWSGRYLVKLKTHYRTSSNSFVFALIFLFCLIMVGIAMQSLKNQFLT